jgi:hypothetical protein
MLDEFDVLRERLEADVLRISEELLANGLLARAE